MLGAQLRRAAPLAGRALRVASQTRANSVLARYGLDDWKVSYPLGLIAAIPIIHNEVIILSEETQLVGCFAFFCGTVYNIANESVAEMLDKRGKDIMAQHNAVEEAAISATRETIKAHEDQIALLSQLTALVTAQKSAAEELAVAKTMEHKHKTRDDIVKKLDTLLAKEEQVQASLSARMVDEAAAAVTAEFESSEIKDKALAEAIAVIEGTEQPKLVASMFVDFFQAKGEAASKTAGTEVSLSDADIAEIKDELTAIMKRDGIEGVELPVPTKVTL